MRGYGERVSDGTSPRGWLPLAIAVVVTAIALAWAVALPRWDCVSGFDTIACADRLYEKWAVALGGFASGPAVALALAGAIRLARRTRRPRVRG